MTFSSHYQWMQENFGAVIEKNQELGKTIRQAGPLDAKTAHFIQLAAAATNRAEGAVHSHARRALEAGATGEEIYHALLLLTSTVGFPAVAAALSWAREEVEKK